MREFVRIHKWEQSDVLSKASSRLLRYPACTAWCILIVFFTLATFQISNTHNFIVPFWENSVAVCLMSRKKSQIWVAIRTKIAAGEQCVYEKFCLTMRLTWTQPFPPPSCVLWSRCQTCRRDTWWGRICWQSNMWHPPPAAGAQTLRQGCRPTAWRPWRVLPLHPDLWDEERKGGGGSKVGLTPFRHKKGKEIQKRNYRPPNWLMLSYASHKGLSRMEKNLPAAAVQVLAVLAAAKLNHTLRCRNNLTWHTFKLQYDWVLKKTKTNTTYKTVVSHWPSKLFLFSAQRNSKHS